MKLLPKSKPKNYWLSPKLENVIKLTPLFLIPFTMQVSAAESTKTGTLSEKNGITKVENQRTTIKLSLVQKQIKGKVIDESGIPIPGANIIVKGTNVSTQTDFNGAFVLNATDNATKLIISFIGMESQEVSIGNSPITVTLKESGQSLKEVVITGYGKQSRSTLTTSISKLDTRILETSSRSNVATALQGTISGLRVTNNTGQPGSTPSIVLRGGTNFNGSGSPLILVDGIPSDFYALNPDDVASIEVLKDAASTAIYGARSANGVILVTTKTGKAGRSSINY